MSSFTYNLIKPYTLIKKKNDLNIKKLGSTQVCIKTLYTAISPGTELAAYKGDPPLRPTKKIFPRLLGYCNVGKIINIGSKVKNWSIGNLVLNHTAHQTYNILNTSELICKIPYDAYLPDIATTYLFHLGYSACLEAKLVAGHDVGIIGLGTLGLTSGAIASLFGANVYGFSKYIKNNAHTKRFGFKNIISKTSDNFKNAADIVITTSNSWSDWRLALQIARPGGTIAVLGFPGRNQTKVEFNPLSSEYFYDKQLKIVSCGYSPDYDIPKKDLRFTLKRNCQFLISSILEGQLPASKLVIEVVSANKLETVYNKMCNFRNKPGTYVLRW